MQKHPGKWSKTSSRGKQSPPFHVNPCNSCRGSSKPARVRGKGKHYPWPRNARKMARELAQGVNKEKDPHVWEALPSQQPRLGPAHSPAELWSPLSSTEAPTQSLAEAGRRSPRAESAPREDNKDWEVNEDRQATCWTHAQEPPTKMTSTRPGEATVTGLLLRKKLF